LFGVVERIYQKEDFLVRHEFKVSNPMTIDEFTSLVRGGVSEYTTHQAIFFLAQQVGKLAEAQKFANEQLATLIRLEQARLEREKKERN